MQADLAGRFRRFAERAGTSPLYQQLAFQIAEDQTVLRIASEARSTPATLLLLAAVQSLLLEGADHFLRSFYPNLTETPKPAGDVFPHFRSFCQSNEGRIIDVLRTRRIQTNEVRRCCYIALGLSLVAERTHRFSVIDVGSSAGLHLLWRRFGYDYSGTRLGVDSSPVKLCTELRGPCRPSFPAEWPQPVEQIGIDLHPLDPCDPDDRTWLRALIWPDQRDRAALLERALSIAAIHPPKVVAGDVFDRLPEMLDDMPPDVAVCVCHNHVINQFSEAERSRFDELLMRLGSGRDVYRLAAEWIGTQTTEFTMARYRDGGKSHKLLALVDDHGAWLKWSIDI